MDIIYRSVLADALLFYHISAVYLNAGKVGIRFHFDSAFVADKFRNLAEACAVKAEVVVKSAEELNLLCLGVKNILHFNGLV